MQKNSLPNHEFIIVTHMVLRVVNSSILPETVNVGMVPCAGKSQSAQNMLKENIEIPTNTFLRDKTHLVSQ